ncbi:hypothetical protein CARUB_v10022121mg [Capsella rubella]|uniref:Defensin-like protein 263 n=1 Tax=Capsella rubella TaxID=81985 RepID=R0GFH6_9BRAS|nr:putative defensin-like protein 263 [Capsella rubella]EOA34567.1 hypothetical protein CARUB_v10022121mg [Capsella rubella]
MEKRSLKLVFLLSLTVIAFCLSMGDAREMAVDCIGGKCPKGQIHCDCLPLVAPPMDSYETKVSCRRDKDCIKYCPKGCKIVNCNFGTCFCEC